MSLDLAQQLGPVVANTASYLPALGPRDALSVLCYHSIGDDQDRFTVTADVFAAHLATINESGIPVVDLAALDAHGGRGVAITFDDSSPSHLIAAEMLADRGIPATFFLNPGDLDRPGYLTSSQADRLLALGMGIGAHGYNHEPVVGITPENFTSSVEACREFLIERNQPLFWAYVGGDIGSFTADQDRMLLDRGFNCRLTTVEGPYRRNMPERPRSRYVIRHDSSLRYVGAAIRGGLQLITVLKRASSNTRDLSSSSIGY